MALTSAAGIIALLDEPDANVQVFALTKLNQVVDTFWAEIADVVGKIEVLYEDASFAERKLAALVASKVYYHLGELGDALAFALGAGDLFDVDNRTRSPFVETVISRSIDTYIEQRVHPKEGEVIDERLVDIVERMFGRCLASNSHRQAIGIALESRRLDALRNAIEQSPNVEESLEFTLRITLSTVNERAFRHDVLTLLVDLFMARPKVNYESVFECLVTLTGTDRIAEVLKGLAESDESRLVAYQLAFVLYDTAPQGVLHGISALLPSSEPNDVASKICDILAGEYTGELHQEFLYRNNQSDLLLLKHIMDQPRSNSIIHSATVICNALMHAGTASDKFLRDNLKWLQVATNWSKFTAVASLGVIHKGHVKQSLNLMSAYLPSSIGGPSSPYAHGGALYALGLIHANNGKNIVSTLIEHLVAPDNNNEVVQHGACLGIGCAAMGTNDATAYGALKDALFTDGANVGEAAGIAMGLVMLGSMDGTALEEMISYAHETQHEKIIRGLAVGISMCTYARAEGADTVIEQLASDKDPLLRCAAMYSCGMAYAGTSSNKVIRRLLHVGVSDTDDDVRRAAIIALGFLLLRDPQQCPAVVSLLSESYNPHVRYASAMALGIACAGTGLKEALNLLEPLSTDSVDYVRQGAMMAMAMIVIQQSEAQCKQAVSTRKAFDKVITNKHEDPMARFGAIVAQGIVDAGGRNVTISLQTRSGQLHAPSIVGLMVMTQFWSWHPLVHFVSLAFTPTCVVCLNKDLKMPKMQLRSDATASLYAYPPKMEPPKTETREKVSTAVLSITNKAKRARERKAAAAAPTKDDGPAPMDVATADGSGKKEGDDDEKDAKKSAKEADEKKAEKEKEEEQAKNAPFTMLDNPARVVPAQVPCVVFPDDCRYAPIVKLENGLCGVIVVDDKKSGEEEELIEFTAPKAEGETTDTGSEPAPPEPFEYLDEETE